MKIAVIGSGPAGYTAAIRCAELGAEVFLFEKKLLGGACLNWACIPTKFMLNSTVSKPWCDSIKEKDDFISMRRDGLKTLLENHGIQIIMGEASVRDAHTVICNDETIFCDRIILATGSVPKRLPILPNALDAEALLKQDNIPERCAIIGGGAVGLEFAVMLTRAGSHVTIFEMMPHILPREDQEASITLERALKRKHIDIFTSCTIQSVTDNTIVFSYKNETKGLATDLILSGIGQSPFISDSITEIQHDRSGISVNEYMETSAPGIYAIGDVTGGMMLAHTGKAQALVAAENAINGNCKRFDDSAVPRCVFTDPEFAAVGITEEEAKDEILIGKFPMGAHAVASVKGERTGFIKVIADKGSHQILGASIIGLDANLIISNAVLAIKNRMTLEDIEDTIFAHPTLTEGFWEACTNALHRSIDI
ncbi:MAG: FAD-dependent oxidoreductase [Dehalococcoidales bacterium]|nr:FAD-dependent oxidoreductase [Dehalococcoidales bacterium]